MHGQLIYKKASSLTVHIRYILHHFIEHQMVQEETYHSMLGVVEFALQDNPKFHHW